MGKRNLKDKISDVVFWTAVFIILYFLVAYLLESNWLEETLELGKVYSLLKDTLGLTAAFLAPVAAFVLFQDWREQHTTLNNKELSIKIKENAEWCFNIVVTTQLSFRLLTLEDKNFQLFIRQYFEKLTQIEKYLDLIEADKGDQFIQAYLKNCEKITNLVFHNGCIINELVAIAGCIEQAKKGYGNQEVHENDHCKKESELRKNLQTLRELAQALPILKIKKSV